MKPKEIDPAHIELLKRIGLRIKKLRQENGKSYIEMAEEIGISRNGYNQLELGKVYFSFSTLIKVLEYHNISLSEFFKDL